MKFYTKKKAIIGFFILLIILTIITWMSVVILGTTYTYTQTISNSNNIDINNISVQIEDGENTVRLIDKKLNNNKLKLTFESVSKRKNICRHLN